MMNDANAENANFQECAAGVALVTLRPAALPILKPVNVADKPFVVI
ncbi:hypothetical protein M3I53_09620 [Paraburkholderia sp. CNPSo 3272]|nr:hypothetical protein [Paraburkholderia sp. CNPSo 3272]MCP3723391.1 hypothetical protein [Paraburkholderia sp. CNPSo 3272]